MKKRYIVTLTAEERRKLEQLIQSGKHKTRKITRARILRKVDESKEGPAWTDNQVREALDVGTATVERVRKRFVEEGLEAALNRRKHLFKKTTRKLDGHQEAQLLALVCGDPPDGHTRWSLRLLANKLVTLEIVESISHETVRQTLKKTN